MRFTTQLLHRNFDPDKTTGSTTQPIYQTSAYYQPTAEDMVRVFNGRQPGFVYTRVGNPTLASFERRLAALEGGIGAVSFASGMSAVSMSIMNIVGAGDEIVSNGSLFGGTGDFFRELSTYNVTIKYVASSNVEDFASLITEKTKLIYAETIGNPKLDIVDIEALAKLAHSYNLPLFIDNTVTTPYLVKPLSLGADVVIHSTSKAINGNGNSIGGVVVVGSKFKWNADKFPKLKDFTKFKAMSYLVKLRTTMLTDFGGCMSPFNAYLTGIGLDTLALRMERACNNALQLAEFCMKRDNVIVNYPGLETNTYHALAKKQFNNRYGTMMTLKLGSQERAFKFINSLKYALNVSNIGDARTLVIHPCSTIYLHASDEAKKNADVTEDLVRVNVGIEDIEDLIEDFSQAFRNLE